MLTNADYNLSAMAGVCITADAADTIVEEGQVIDEAGMKLEVLHTPGHTQGGICLLSKGENVLFVGDTLFADSVGRTDFPGGSMPQLIKNIKEKLLELGDDMVVYPGHGEITTIGQEKAYNPFLR